MKIAYAEFVATLLWDKDNKPRIIAAQTVRFRIYTVQSTPLIVSLFKR